MHLHTLPATLDLATLYGLAVLATVLIANQLYRHFD